VSIWRLTTERQVWYEWHAESFLPIIRHVAANADLGRLQSVSNTNSGVFGSVSPLTSAFLDADSSTEGRQDSIEILEASTSTFETVKIGQTSLHNPGGRSSWIGL
jgi:type II protein arginine methyltransferase